MTIKILPNDKRHPKDKLADVELHFTHGGPLVGMKLVGFAIWHRGSDLPPKVTMPARDYTVDNLKRSFALLRPIDSDEHQRRLVDLILQAWDTYLISQDDPYGGVANPYVRR